MSKGSAIPPTETPDGKLGVQAPLASISAQVYVGRGTIIGLGRASPAHASIAAATATPWVQLVLGPPRQGNAFWSDFSSWL